MENEFFNVYSAAREAGCSSHGFLHALMILEFSNPPQAATQTLQRYKRPKMRPFVNIGWSTHM